MNRQEAAAFFSRPPYIIETASIAGKRENEGPLWALFDMVGENDKFGQDTWEEAESSLQKDAVTLVLGKSGIDRSQVRYVFAGDLLGQTIASSFGLHSFGIPLFGLYGVCSTCGEAPPLVSESYMRWCRSRNRRSCRKRVRTVERGIKRERRGGL